jgi:3D-(3,5/4)-trihydroxycyclohexane-1,2-dione acylhydrolase (decyclizing)
MNTRRLTTAGAVVEFLKKQYVERDGVEHRLIHGVFGIFGHGNVAGLGQALEERGGRALPYHQPKNEQAMVHTAAAFAKARRGLGTFACTTSIGPGATNMLTGAAGATINRLPVLLLPGDVFASRRPDPVLQQLESPHARDVSVNDCFRPVSRFWDRIQRPEQLLAALPEAMRVLSDPASTGAVTLALCQDVQAEAFDFPDALFEPHVYRIARARPDRDALARAAALIRESRRPLIVAGGGVYYSEAEEALRALAERTGLPVAVTQAGKGVLPDAHPQCLGAVGVTGTLAADQIAADADLVICLGTRLSDFTTASKTQFQDPGVRFVAVNVSAYDAHKHGALPLVADARAAIADLLAALEGWRIPAEHEQRVAAARAEWERAWTAMVHPAHGLEGLLHQAEVIRIVNELVDEQATVVHAAGGLPGDLHKLWKSRASGDYHSEYGYSCMGYEIAGALGVKMAQPAREVYALVGDGSYLMLNHEIVTSVQEGRKITLVLLDNHGYQCIHNLQRACGSAGFGNEFRSRAGDAGLQGAFVEVDYVANARSLGAWAASARTADEVRAALLEARAQERTAVVHVPVEPSTPLPGYSWWDVPIAEESESPAVRGARAAYEEARRRERFFS